MTRQFTSISSQSEKRPGRPRQISWFDRLKNNRLLWQGKIGPAFWTITGAISLTVNLILVVILIFLGQELFALKSLISDQLIGGLHDNFVKMDEATIETTIQVNDTILVNDTIPVQFTLPLQTNTDVVLTQDTPISNATVTIITPYFTLNNAPTDIILPAGTRLPVALDLQVPVDTTIPVVINVPVALNVPVNIPLNQTELHEPFVGLQEVVGPYDTLLSDAPASWEEALCGEEPGALCALVTSEEE